METVDEVSVGPEATAEVSVTKLSLPMEAPFGPPLRWELAVSGVVLGWFPCMLHAFYVGKLVTTGEFSIGKSHEIRRTETGFKLAAKSSN